jgi:hypothetical protein
MSFLRHEEIYRSDVFSKPVEGWGRSAASRWSAPEPSQRTRRKERVLPIVRDEFPAGYSLAGCSPAEPASASPTGSSMRWSVASGNQLPANGNLSLISVSQPRGAVQSVPGCGRPGLRSRVAVVVPGCGLELLLDRWVFHPCTTTPQ